MMELTKPQRTANPDNDDPLSGVPGGGEDEEEAGGIANMRVVNASKVVRQINPAPFSERKDAVMCIMARATPSAHLTS